MKILLLDDYSGLFKNLRSGLLDNGHEVTFIGTGDRWKKIEGMDITIHSSDSGLIGKVIRRLQVLWHLPKMSGFDVVLIINQSFLFRGISSLMIWFLSNFNKSIFLSASGGDVPYAKYGLSGGFKKNHWPYEGFSDKKLNNYLAKSNVRLHERLTKKISGVIPIAFEYAESWRNSDYKEIVLPTIPPPINVDEIAPAFIQPNKDKIVIFHGLNREEYKGTKLITTAMKNMKKKFPNDIEIIIDGKMPLKKYLNTLADTDIVIDQCKAYSYSSMNSLYSMALGKIVMVHCEDECIEEFNLQNSPPIFKIKPDVEQIESQIKKAIDLKNELHLISRKSRSYVESVHSHKIIAKKYINYFNGKYD